jgi:hypothetical protein
VQGHLRNEQLKVSIQTGCAHSGRPISIDIDSGLNYVMRDKEATPLIFVPMVDFDLLEAPSIIDAF